MNTDVDLRCLGRLLSAHRGPDAARKGNSSLTPNPTATVEVAVTNEEG